MPTPIHVINAKTRDVKNRVHSAITALHRESQKEVLYAGLTRTYQPNDESGDQLPGESTRHQLDADDVLAEATRLWTEAWDLEATLARSNQDARADLVIDGETIVADLPATYFLYLEKQLADVYTFISKIPVLDPAERWTWDEARGCWATEPTQTTRTRKTPKGAVLVEPTKEHPAQVERYSVDEIVGRWTLVKFSGALPVERKRELLLRVARVRDAVKEARERANQTAVTDLKPAVELLSYVLRRDHPTVD